jgi:chemotaxis protein MotB
MVSEQIRLDRAQAERRWMITFSDLISLLLAFFVMLFAMSSVDPEPWKVLSNALSAKLNPGHERVADTSLTDQTVDTVPLIQAADLGYLQVVISEKLQSDPILSQARVTMLDDRIVISLKAEYLFPRGEGVLGNAAMAAIKVLGDALGHVENRVDINGHTAPAITAGGAAPLTWELSIYRAVAVADALRNTGYSREITAMGHGDAGFAALSGDLTEVERRALAQRVDVVIRDTSSMVTHDDS